MGDDAYDQARAAAAKMGAVGMHLVVRDDDGQQRRFLYGSQEHDEWYGRLFSEARKSSRGRKRGQRAARKAGVIDAPDRYADEVPRSANAIVADQASQFCGVCGAFTCDVACAWCGSSSPAESATEELAHQVLEAAYALIAGLLARLEDDWWDRPIHGDFWKMVTGPRVSINGAVEDSDGTRSPLCIEIVSYERASAELALIMNAHGPYASLAACYPCTSPMPTRYSRVALRSGDTIDLLARLVASAWLVQTIESRSASVVLAPKKQEGGPIPTIADLASTYAGPRFSFNADVDSAHARWDALPHVTTHRQGEVFIMNVARTLIAPSSGIQASISAVLQEHPAWGEGLLVTGCHTADWSVHDPSEVESFVRKLADDDRARNPIGTGTDFLGSWCVAPARGPAFATFVPEPLCQPGILVRLVDQLLGRFDWMARVAG